MIADENNLVFLDKKMSTLLEANDSNAEGAKDFRKSMRQLGIFFFCTFSIKYINI